MHRIIARNGQTLTGLDVLEQQGFAPLKGKRVGLDYEPNGASTGKAAAMSTRCSRPASRS